MSERTQDFDIALTRVTQNRGKIYGHPRDDFARVAKLKSALPQFKDDKVRHIAEMICVKLCRLAETPDHLDSWIDIAGYARTGVMVTDYNDQSI